MARILLVEDNPVDARLLRTLLEARGHVVALAGDAEAAYAIARGAPPDLIVTDIVLPGMNGFALAAQTRALAGRRIPVLGVSAYYDATEADLRHAGAIDALIAKPIDAQALVAKVDHLLAAAKEQP